MSYTTPRQQRPNATDAQTLADVVRIVSAIAQKAVGTTARAPPIRLQWRDRIHQR